MSWTEHNIADRFARSGLFEAGSPIHIARAPGRLDVMGGIADYSGSTVLEMPIAAATWAAVQRRTDGRLLVHTSLDSGLIGTQEFDLCAWLADYPTVRERFDGDARRKWVRYVAGAFTVLARERGATFRDGATVAIESDVPVGAGVSSSAAVEIASMTAIGAAYGLALDGMETARLCQIVENRIAGAPCGIMDQVTSMLGRADHLLALLCRPATVLGHERVPRGWRFVAIDSAVKHRVGGSKYARARVASFMGFQMLRARHPAMPPGGYLAGLSMRDLHNGCGRSFLPKAISGRRFLDQHADWPDPVTAVDPDETYPVRAATLHPIRENESVTRMRDLLAGGETRHKEIAGWLMLTSHDRYGRLGLGCPETDRLVELAKELGPARGLYGARVTGGGSGGAVAILMDDTPRAEEAVQTVLERYREETGKPARLIDGSSDGAEIFGTREVRV